MSCKETKVISSSFGKNLRITIFGGSHEPYIGVTIAGLPEGKYLDFGKIQKFMDRRAPGNSEFTTSRKEKDQPIVISGMAKGKTTKEPLTLIIENTNIRKEDYRGMRDIPRPGHADYTGAVKYGNTVNLSGGGPFSGRMTAPLCIAGAISQQFLEERDVFIGAHIFSIGDILDSPFDSVLVSDSDFKEVVREGFPVRDKSQGEKMCECIRAVMEKGDSIGGIVECAAIGVEPGLGGAMYDSLEGYLSRIFFGIPAVKGVEFGAGFGAAGLLGSENNDPFYMKESKVATLTNHHGGILGGITSGMPIICRLGFKPTPSIPKEQKSVSLSKGTNEKLSIVGRHDPCVAVRAVPAVEAAMAVGILDVMLGEEENGCY